MGIKTSLDYLKFAEHYTEFAPGTIIFREGDPGGEMFVIKEGTVELRIGNQVLEQVGAGNVLGEMALIDSGARSATARAVTRCQLVSIDVKKFTYMIRQTPYFALDVMRIMAQRLRKMNHTTVRVPVSERVTQRIK